MRYFLIPESAILSKNQNFNMGIPLWDIYTISNSINTNNMHAYRTALFFFKLFPCPKGTFSFVHVLVCAY